MASAVNTGARLDRLPISSFHYRIFWLIGAGMFFDGYDLYVGASVLGAAVQTKFAVLAQVPQFISWLRCCATSDARLSGSLPACTTLGTAPSRTAPTTTTPARPR
ncbi:MAG TPA: hypothetical protein VLL30_16375, partial [Reyranella sp.]|nr:hypothetical protein [Reyranella sp.]